MSERSCSTCKYDGKSLLEFPCNECTNNRCRDHYAPMTNADIIRQMTDEELAEIIMCHMGDGHCDDAYETNCIECTLRWLKEEVAT